LPRAVLLDQVTALEGLADDAQQLRPLERLGEEVVGAILHRLYGFLDGAEGGEEDHVDVGRDRLRGVQDLDAGQPRHLEIGQDEIDAAALQALERGVAIGGHDHPKALAGEHAFEALAQPRVVVGHQETGRLRHGRLG